jgi:hypothetical protein
MKRITPTFLFGAIVTCAAAALAGPSDNTNSLTMTDAESTYKQLMKQCVDKERQQNSAASTEDLKKTCRPQVKSQMAQLRSQGQLPPANPYQHPQPSSPASPPEYP